MSWDAAFLRRHAIGIALGAGGLAMLVGLLAFAVSLRPCRLALSPGLAVTYRLRTELAEVLPNGRERPLPTQERTVDLVCIGGDDEVALVEDRREVTLLSFKPDGTARALDAAAHPTEAGRAIGFFDFNLLPMPPDGGSQEWRASLVYARLPPGRRQLSASVKRTRTGSHPEFQLKLPESVEWVGDDGLYRQVRKLVCTYRFNTGRGLVEEAQVKLTAGVELPAGGVRQTRVTTTLTLVSSGRSGEDPRRLRELALAGADARLALETGEGAKRKAAAQRLAAAPVALPALREAGERLARALSEPPAPWQLRLDPDGDAAGVAARLALAGWKAQVEGSCVLVGPFPRPDPVLARDLARRAGGGRTEWIRR